MVLPSGCGPLLLLSQVPLVLPALHSQGGGSQKQVGRLRDGNGCPKGEEREKGKSEIKLKLS